MTTCQLCQGHRSDAFSKNDAKAKGSLALMRCQDCGLVQQTEIPSAEALSAYYSHHYRQDYKKTWTPKPKHVRRAGRAAISRMRFLTRFLPHERGLLLTDIGAGGGEFVYVASQLGLAAQGIEPNVGYSTFARQEYGVTVNTADLSALKAQSTDVITLFHVLEHLPTPTQSIEMLYHALRHRGLLFIEVPNILQKDASPHNIYFRAHLYYFSIHTLAAAASPFFELLGFEDHGNIKAVFRKRPHPVATRLPSAAEVEDARRRFHHKGWLEYLFQGGGLLKPFSKLRQRLQEASVSKLRPREILDNLIATHRSASPAETSPPPVSENQTDTAYEFPPDSNEQPAAKNPPSAKARAPVL